MAKCFPLAWALLLILAAGASQAPGQTVQQRDPKRAGEFTCLQQLQTIEMQGRFEANQLVDQIEAAANAGDGPRFCAASSQLLSTFERLRQAAAACSSARAAVWEQAEAASSAALEGTCR